MSDREGVGTIVRDAFAAWASGTGDFVDILDEDVVWTIVGSGPSARTFVGRGAFLDGGFGPIAATFASPMRPKLLGVHVDGAKVIVRWDGVAEMLDGQTYRNSYAWFFELAREKVVRVEAFLDLPTYDAALDGRALPTWPASSSHHPASTWKASS